MEKKFWFKNKSYGWGWAPASIEGWLVTGIYVLVAVIYHYLAKIGFIEFSLFNFVSIMIVSTSAFIFLCYKKGEKPRWRWGHDK